MNNSFDKHIRKKLEQVEIKFDNASWSDLEDKLLEEGLLNPDQVTPKNLSEAKHEMTPQSTDWDSFSEILSQAESNNFDTQVQDKLQDYEADYKDESWHRLHKQMSLRDAKDRSIFYNVLKIAAVFLLFFLGYNSIESIQESKSIQEFTENYLEDLKQLPLNPLVLVGDSSKEKKKYKKYQPANTKKYRDQFIEPTLATGSIPKFDEGILFTTNSDETSSKRTSPSLLGHSNSLAMLASPSDVENNLNLHLKNLEEFSISDYYRSLGSEKSNRIKRELGRDSEESTIYDASSKKKSKTSKFGFYTTASVDEIDVYLANGSDRKSDLGVSNGVGAELEYAKGKNGIKLGAEYKQLEYQNNRTSLKLLNVPVEYKYTAAQNQNTKLYAIAGVEGHFTMSSEYNSINRSNQEVNDGLLNGGEWDENVYATANAGFGFEQNITKKISLFGEAVYKNALGTSLLTENDDIPNNSFMIKVGGRYHFE